MKRLFFTTIVALSFVACGSGNGNGTGNPQPGETGKPQEKQLNISILLDLSDRISPQINPDASKNDIENIKTITAFFKANMEKLGAYKAKGKIKIFFCPPPTNADINSTAEKLMIDCSKMDNRGRKNVFDNITELYTQNLERIYQETIATSTWLGSDIWRFFKDDVKDFCIEKDTVYRNILIILTDGYLYHKQSVYNVANRYTYLLGGGNLNNLSPYRKPNWEQLIERNSFGIKKERDDLSDLEVLVLEIKAENPNYKIDEDILSFVWKKWFNEMNISHYEAYSSNQPAYTKTRIENFLNQE